MKSAKFVERAGSSAFPLFVLFVLIVIGGAAFWWLTA